MALSRRLATAQRDHDGKENHPREGCAALVLNRYTSAGLAQLRSGRRGCQQQHTRDHCDEQSGRIPLRREAIGPSVGYVGRARDPTLDQRVTQVIRSV
jgi:hypothetical protein